MNNSKVLEKKVNLPEFGLVTRAQFMQYAKGYKEGSWTVEAKEMDGYERGEYNRIKFNRMGNQGEQDAYEARLKVKKRVYSIYPPDRKYHYNISKAEFDYFNSLEYVKIGDQIDLSTWTAAPGFKGKEVPHEHA